MASYLDYSLHAIQQYLRPCFWSKLSKMLCSTKLKMCKCFISRKTVWKALFIAIEFLYCFASISIRCSATILLAFLKMPSMVLCFRLSFSFFATWAAAIRYLYNLNMKIVQMFAKKTFLEFMADKTFSNTENGHFTY